MTWWRALGCALVLATAGCNGGNGDDFTDEANAVCTDYDARIGGLATPRSLSELAESTERIAELIEEGTAKLWKLVPPDSDGGDFGVWLHLNETAALNARRLSKAAAAGERERVVVLAERARETEAEADALAEELGLGDCLIGEPRSP
jgi:hypothetical protein